MHDRVRRALRDMLGPAVGVGVTDPRDPVDDLWPQERRHILQAIPKRQHEFAAGRRAVREAMVALGLPPVAIGVGQQRAPVWPAGLTGSIAHCDELCIAVVSQSHETLGIDIEPATALEPDLIGIVCTETEQTALRQMSPAMRGSQAKRIFCAKEAVYKAQYPLTGQMVGFDGVSISLDQKDGFSTLWHAPFTHMPVVHGRVILCANFHLAVASTAVLSAR